MTRRSKYWLKNFSRFLVALAGILAAILLADQLSKFLGLLGALCCAPLALTMPTVLHLKTLAKTKSQKIRDMLIIMISIAILVFSTTQSIATW